MGNAIDKQAHEVQIAATQLIQMLADTNVPKDVGNAALAMALAISARYSGMTQDEAAARFGVSLRAVYREQPKWQ